jgi:hypothetical protein
MPTKPSNLLRGPSKRNESRGVSPNVRGVVVLKEVPA